MADHLDRAGVGFWLTDGMVSQHGASGAFVIHSVAFAFWRRSCRFERLTSTTV